ncbi:hypothetical protein EVAR_59230_1 [Eumeta japonica]|uniref:Uncharacterized protein n=1 Tax=Eumeta variegata TaxID=151549 RepID=A0A4C1ZI42_EUMVA|nr:hypothetical protein EVAR_59230_1 [Eumeta japonica]
MHDRPFHKTGTIFGPAPLHKPDVVLGSIIAGWWRGFCCHRQPLAGRMSPDDLNYHPIPAHSVECPREGMLALRARDWQHSRVAAVPLLEPRFQLDGKLSCCYVEDATTLQQEVLISPMTW